MSIYDIIEQADGMDKPIVTPNDTGSIRTVMITPTKFYDTVSNCKYNVPHFFQLERYSKTCSRCAWEQHQLRSNSVRDFPLRYR
jgi:hypothetical protein